MEPWERQRGRGLSKFGGRSLDNGSSVQCGTGIPSTRHYCGSTTSQHRNSFVSSRLKPSKLFIMDSWSSASLFTTPYSQSTSLKQLPSLPLWTSWLLCCVNERRHRYYSVDRRLQPDRIFLRFCLIFGEFPEVG